jgi:hypothetical protein
MLIKGWASRFHNSVKTNKKNIGKITVIDITGKNFMLIPTNKVYIKIPMKIPNSLLTLTTEWLSNIL